MLRISKPKRVKGDLDGKSGPKFALLAPPPLKFMEVKRNGCLAGVKKTKWQQNFSRLWAVESGVKKDDSQ